MVVLGANTINKLVPLCLKCFRSWPPHLLSFSKGEVTDDVLAKGTSQVYTTLFSAFTGDLQRPVTMTTMCLFQAIWVIHSFLHSTQCSFKPTMGQVLEPLKGTEHGSSLPGVSDLVGRTVKQTNNNKTVDWIS